MLYFLSIFSKFGFVFLIAFSAASLSDLCWLGREIFSLLIPLLSILFSDVIEKINTYISNIDEDKWNEVKRCADEYILKYNDYAREGMEYFIEEK